MISTIQIVTPPTSEPVTIDLVRRHCRIDQTGDDDLLYGYITTARVLAEMYLGRALLTQTIRWILTPEGQVWPRVNRLHGTLEIPRAPTQSIQSVTALDTRGNSTAVNAAALPIPAQSHLLGYRVDLAQMPARLTIGLDTVLTDGRLLRQVELENIQVVMIAGYTDVTLIPPNVIQGILLTVAYLYENRGDVTAGLPKSAEWLFDFGRNPLGG